MYIYTYFIYTLYTIMCKHIIYTYICYCLYCIIYKYSVCINIYVSRRMRHPHDKLLTFFIVIIANNNEIISKPRHDVDIVVVAAALCFFSFQPVIHQRPLLAKCNSLKATQTMTMTLALTA